jgi:hypothetical protein
MFGLAVSSNGACLQREKVKNWREKMAEKENTAFPTISWYTIRKVFLRKDLNFVPIFLTKMSSVSLIIHNLVK